MNMLKLVNRTENRKLSDGKQSVAATYRPVGVTCPSECGLLNNGCYAQKGYVRLSEQKSKARNDDLDRLSGTDIKLIRHHVSGDFFLKDKLDKKYIKSVFDFHRDNPTIQGWTYTHRARELQEKGYGPENTPKNLTVLASVDSIEEGEALQKMGWRIARVTTENDRQAGEVKCRYEMDNTKCNSCRLCWSKNKKIKGILFQKK